MVSSKNILKNFDTGFPETVVYMMHSAIYIAKPETKCRFTMQENARILQKPLSFFWRGLKGHDRLCESAKWHNTQVLYDMDILICIHPRQINSGKKQMHS